MSRSSTTSVPYSIACEASVRRSVYTRASSGTAPSQPRAHVDALDLVLDAAARQPRAVVVDEQRGGLVLERVGVLNAA